MMETLVGIALFANFVGHQFEPIQDLKNLLRLYNLPWYFSKVFYCSRCIGFWAGWIYTGSFYQGLAASFLSVIFDFIFKEIERRNQQ